jgi:hypothetical protein
MERKSTQYFATVETAPQMCARVSSITTDTTPASLCAVQTNTNPAIVRHSGREKRGSTVKTEVCRRDEFGDLIAVIHSYAPGDGQLSFVAQDPQTHIALSPCPTREECALALADRDEWELYNNGTEEWPSWRARKTPATEPALTKRLSWRTKQDQFFRSFGCGQAHVIEFISACESCGRSIYSHGCIGAKLCGDLVTDSPDPRGIIPAEHCLNLYHASEYGLTGRDLVTCATCADDSDKYRALMAQAKHSGTWTDLEVIDYLCATCGKTGPEHGHYDATNPNTHKFVCSEVTTK